MEKDHALIIGIKDYTELSDLNGPTNDAENFRDWLISESGGNVPEGQCHMILSKPDPYHPVQLDIDKKLGEIYENSRNTQPRRLYFFFAGHGLGAAWNDNALCLPEWSKIFRNLALSSAGYLKIIVESGRFKEVFFFLDCCRNRVTGSIPANPYINWPRPGRGAAACESFVAYASEFDNTAHEASLPDENGQEVQGYFTRALIRGLKKGEAAQGGEITTQSLKSYLKRKVKELSNDKQSARFEDNFTDVGIIYSGQVDDSRIELVINFTDDGDMELKGPELETIERGPSSDWPNSIPVKQGLYQIKNHTTDRKELFAVEINYNPDGSTKPFSYDF